MGEAEREVGSLEWTYKMGEEVMKILQQLNQKESILSRKKRDQELKKGNTCFLKKQR